MLYCKSKLVGVPVVFLCEVLRAHRWMLAGFPISTFRFNKINPLPPSFLLYGPTFTVKRYGMKEYPFRFALNIATAKNNTSLRIGFSFDWSHNTWISQSGFYITNYTWPIPFRQVPWLSNGFLNLNFWPLWKYKENTKKFLWYFAQNYKKTILFQENLGVYRQFNRKWELTPQK